MSACYESPNTCEAVTATLLQVACVNHDRGIRTTQPSAHSSRAGTRSHPAGHSGRRGDLELVDVTGEGEVHIRLLGACIDCPSAHLTLEVGIEQNLMARIPEVTKVLAVD